MESEITFTILVIASETVLMVGAVVVGIAFARWIGLIKG